MAERPDLIGLEGMKRLEGRNIKELSLEEALDLKVFIHVGAIDATMLPELNRHIEILYEKEAAPDQVEALHAAYRDSRKLWQEMEKLKEQIDTTMSDIVRAKSASFSFGEDKEVRYSFIKRAEEGFKAMVGELEQKTKDFGLLEAEIKRLLPEIEELKRKYLTSHRRPVGNIPWEYKVRAWGIVKKALSAAAAAAAEAEFFKATGRRISRVIHSKSRREQMESRREQMETAADQRWAQTDGAEAVRWAERIQGVVLAPPPPVAAMPTPTPVVVPYQTPKPAPKAVNLSFFSWTHDGEDYFTNDRGDVVSTEFVWVGRFDGTKIDSSVPEPADLADAKMRTAAVNEMRLSHEQLKSGVKLEKKNAPCARLYSCVGDKSTGGLKPTTRHVSSECWSHERIDPETGELLTPHKCPWLHPGEPGWQAQWNTDRLWRPASAAPVAASRFAALSSATAPWARAASPPRESRGAFAAKLGSTQRANKEARNTAEDKAIRELNRRESSNAAAAIFPNSSKKNKPKWGIPNLGTGFGGRRTRRNLRKRKSSRKKYLRLHQESKTNQ
jgi:hypothetical protein